MKKFVAKEGDKTAEYVLKDGVNLVGRDESCDVVIDSSHISRNHISCIVSSDRVMIQDLNSRNGTFVNGLRVKDSVEVRNGDVVSLGKYTMVFVSEEAAQAAPPPPPTAAAAPAGQGGPTEPEQEILPLKGDMARVIGRQGQGLDMNLPAKFDPQRYQVMTQDRKIIVTDQTTGQAIELYRGTPDAAMLDQIIAERRARQRRNTILGVLGGAAALVAIVVVALSVGGGPTGDGQTKPTGPNRQQYYQALDAAVVAFKNNNMKDATEKLDAAATTVEKFSGFTLHNQMRSLFSLYDRTGGDLKLLKDKEAWDALSAIDDEEISEIGWDYNTPHLKEWINDRKKELREFRQDKQEFQKGVDLRWQEKLPEALAAFRNVKPTSVYYKDAMKQVDDIGLLLTRQILGADPATLSPVGLTPGKATDMLPRLDQVLNGRLVPDSMRQALVDYWMACIDQIKLEARKKSIIQQATALYEQGKYIEAWQVIQEIKDDPDELVQRRVAEIDQARKLEVNLEDAARLYNEGNAEAALAALTPDKTISIGPLSQKYLTMKNKIADVDNLYKQAQEALKYNDRLEAQSRYNSIMVKEDSDVNEYKRRATSWLTDYEVALETSKQKFGDDYVDQAQKFLDEKDYLRARDFADKANQINPDYNSGQKILNQITEIGRRELSRARNLHDKGQRLQAIATLREITKNRLYNDGDGIEQNVRAELMRWENEG